MLTRCIGLVLIIFLSSLPAIGQPIKQAMRMYAYDTHGYHLVSNCYYDVRGISLVRISYNAVGGTTGIIIYKYDSLKRLLGYSIYDRNGLLKDTTEIVLDKLGNVIPMVFYNADMDNECKNTDKAFCVSCKYNSYHQIVFFEKKPQGDLCLRNTNFNTTIFRPTKEFATIPNIPEGRISGEFPPS